MYQCLKVNHFEDDEGYQLVSIREQDIEPIRLWRNAQTDVLRQVAAISANEQKNYFIRSIRPTFTEKQPKQILFSLLLQHACIGYGGLTNIEWEARRAEVSFLLDTERVQNQETYEKDFTHFLGLIERVAFHELKLHRLFTETFVFRTEHIKVLENKGFLYEGTLKEHIYKKEQWFDSILHGRLNERDVF